MFNPRANTRCIMKACHSLNIPYSICDEVGNWVCVRLNGKEHHFSMGRTSFNSESIHKVARDKEYCYRWIKDYLHSPKTASYVDPNGGDSCEGYFKLKDHNEIAKDIETKFLYPFILKRNSGAEGSNVFLIKNRQTLLKGLKSIYNKRSKDYDTVALAQEFIKIKKEYRVIWFRGQVMMMYEKEINADNKVHLSPFKNIESKARLIEKDSEEYLKIKDFLKEGKYRLNSFEFAGVDVAIDARGRFWIIEINTMPGFNYLTRDNGDEALVKMYKRIFKRVMKREAAIYSKGSLVMKKGF